MALSPTRWHSVVSMPLQQQTSTAVPKRKDSLSEDPDDEPLPKTPPKKQRLWEASTGISPEMKKLGIRSAPVASARNLFGAPSEPIEVQECKKLIAELKSLLVEEVSKDNLLAKLDTLDTSVFQYRKVGQRYLLDIFNADAFFLYSELEEKISVFPDSHSRSRALRVLDGVIKQALTYAQPQQRENLFNALMTDPSVQTGRYKKLQELCYQRYFMDTEGDAVETTVASEEALLTKVIVKINEDLLLPSVDRDLLHKVHAFALEHLASIQAGRSMPVQRFFHATRTSEAVVSILESGIRVEHQAAYEGAFVSTNPELQFGSWGVTVSLAHLASDQPTLTRVERRPEQDGGAIWIGSGKPLKPLRDYVFHGTVSDAEMCEMRSRLSESRLEDTKVLDAKVLDLFMQYVRKERFIIPSPPRTLPVDLRRFHRESESP